MHPHAHADDETSMFLRLDRKGSQSKTWGSTQRDALYIGAHAADISFRLIMSPLDIHQDLKHPKNEISVP